MSNTYILLIHFIILYEQVKNIYEVLNDSNQEFTLALRKEMMFRLFNITIIATFAYSRIKNNNK